MLQRKSTAVAKKPIRASRLRRTTTLSNNNNDTAAATQPVQSPPPSYSSPQQPRRVRKKQKRSCSNTTCYLIGLTVFLTAGLLLSLLYLLIVLDTTTTTTTTTQNKPSIDFGKIYLPNKSQQKSTSSLRKPVKDHQQQQQHRIPVITKNESAIIDMRQLQRTLPFDNPDGGVWKQGWDITLTRQEQIDQPLTVYVVPHSHNDPGWIKTFDAYFQTQTKQIITTVITALQKDKRRKFIWAEMSYFSWWYETATAAQQQAAQLLLQNGQLEFVTGGWVMPDEANANLYAMEMQLTIGHEWIRQTLGAQYIPSMAWSIDPFGYSPTMAWLLQKFGFKAMLIQRVHYAVKKELASKRHLEFYWRQTWDDAGEHDIFTHVMPFFSYDVPHTCGPDPAVCCQFDFKRRKGECPWRVDVQIITPENVKERALLLWDQYKKKASLYRSNTVLIPLGDDFRYQTIQEAEAQYTNYQAMFDYLNENVPGCSIQFGTLSDYFNDVMGTFDTPILKGSFFTYADVNQDYWSGYFTSRVFDKALDRQLERVLYAAETLDSDSQEELQDARKALSLFQHHDGVTGTAKDHVVEDYARRMYDAIRTTQQFMVRQAVSSQAALVESIVGRNEQLLKPCWRSDLPRSLTQNMCVEPKILVYNPLDTPQSCGNTIVKGKSWSTAQLPCETAGPVSKEEDSVVEFDPNTGLMIRPVREEWKVWHVKSGGAYLFFPDKLESYGMSNNVVVEQNGYVVKTEHWKRTVIEQKVPNGAIVLDFIYETHLTIDNQEWFTRFSADINNQGIFHTDLNGFNFDTHYFRKDLPIQSQVFPMPTLASIQDSNQRMTILSEHAQGTASLQDGSVDVWLDRRLKQDDGRGLAQGVQDNRPTRTRFCVLCEKEGYNKNPESEFMVTKLGQLMWDELQHPLEMFGLHASEESNEIVSPQERRRAAQEHEADREERRRRLNTAKQKWMSANGIVASGELPEPMQNHALDAGRLPRTPGAGTAHMAWNKTPNAQYTDIENESFDIQKTVVPFVFMVHKRVSYLRKAIDSLRKSDFPKDRVPLIVSHDGRVPEMMEYVESLKTEFQVIQLFHPFACYDHPDEFPGQDPKLDADDKGDMYGHPRESAATCCKHHFTWLLKTVFTMDLDKTVADNFLFIEEDYIVAPTVYSTIIVGLNAIAQFEKKSDGGFVGVGLDTTEAGTRADPLWLKDDAFFADVFHSGPMTMSRSVFVQLRTFAEDYCKFDDYNWDWSYVHSAGMGHVPHTILFPSRSQAKHIGIKEGMHSSQQGNEAILEIFPEYGEHFETLDKEFRGKRFHGEANVTREERPRGFGGWGHPADQEHCMKLLS